ncbi:polyphosphate kinase 2 family protein [Bifidobacterium sp. SMB2]|uniref:Polyphosphate kinase 2 family protein n=1 Tax=Bifidobacterium saimiriisciurei TaxID=2661627 RepID=A0ABX0CC79_9BIFI|nr:MULTISPECIES: PPK2 family polyphosphate kinase [Bifidobacterium]NEG95859.1 polyphosphate kinase 2 family protein [Bifidobacterium sp. SMB2]NEH12072.1 polyphosphate kinase 2 family protein [Bifidobacterium saimiriisciurei]
MGDTRYISSTLKSASDSSRGLDKAIKRRKSLQRRLELASETSERLSSVWSKHPSSRLRFGQGVTDLADVKGPSTPGFHATRDEGERFIALSAIEIARYQELLYANGAHGSNRRLLIVLQGMDASGKGGIVRHVFRQVNPMGIHYHGFGRPTDEEASHDFLWRIRRELPANGWMSIFDRSHYEDVVMPNVYQSMEEDAWRRRYDVIRRFEKELVADGCAVVKIFLVVSREAQRKQFLERLDDPTKYWKFDVSDLEARDRWDDYMAAWQDVFENTSTDYAPWYIVPADNRWYSRAVVSELLRVTLKSMELSWPGADFDFDEARRRLES